MIDLTKKHERFGLWMEALRSGEYGQYDVVLKQAGEENFCCLGVACDVFQTMTGRGRWDDCAFVVGENESETSLPKPVMEWLGIDQDDPKIGQDHISTLNDSGAYTFEQLANILEGWRDE